MMKTFYLLLLLAFTAPAVIAQNQWSWMGGKQTAYDNGVYGTRGVPASGNMPGGRIGAASWADKQGNLWLFGGRGSGESSTNDPLNDLWKYDIAANTWTWISGDKNGNEPGEYGQKGVAAPGNHPGSRQNAVTWTDKQGNFWLFGGSGLGARGRDQGLLNDLWKFSTATLQWTWVSGDDRIDRRGEYGRGNNDDGDDDDDDDDDDDNDNEPPSVFPGGRSLATGWIDATGNLYLFGGNGYSSRNEVGDLNDVWKYSPADNSWSWEQGDRREDQRVRYGNKGTFENDNTPGGRYGSTGWTDIDGNFWLYGGRSRNDLFADLWKFDRRQNRWAWISGSNRDNQQPDFEEKGVPDENGHPGSRLLSTGFVDVEGNLWVFGGTGYGTLLGSTPLNSLWRYSVANNTWTYFNGDISIYPSVEYGTKGMPAPGNHPGGTTNAVSWKDLQGNFWVFGGQSLQGHLNQLWKFSVACPSALIGTISPATASICKDGAQVLTATGGNAFQWQRNGVNIAGETKATYTARDAGTYTVLVTKGQCTAPASNSAEIKVVTAPTGKISPSAATICEGSSQELTVTGGTSYEWRLNGVTIPGQNKATLVATDAGTYSVIITNGSCSGPASNTVEIKKSALPSGNITPAAASICGNGTQILTASGGTSYQWLKDGSKIAETGSTLTVSEPGTYSVVISNGSCSVQSANDAVITISTTAGTRYADVTTTPNVPVQLSARPDGISYEWIPSTGINNPTIQKPMATVTADREYLVNINNGDGCPITDTVLVKVSASVEKKVFVPTAFTPNGNGVNDQLRPLGNISTLNYFRVYNRWGNLVFQTNEIGAGWDGRRNGVIQPSDTYTWILSGTSSDGQPIKQSGKTLLIK